MPFMCLCASRAASSAKVYKGECVKGGDEVRVEVRKRHRTRTRGRERRLETDGEVS